MTFRALRILGSFALLSVAACAATADDGDSAQREDDHRIRPTGGTTELLVVAPPNAEKAEAAYTADNTNGAKQKIEIGTPASLAPGKGEVRLTVGRSDTGATVVTLAAGTRTTVELAGAVFKKSSGDRVLGLDIPRCSDAEEGCDYASSNAWLLQRVTDARVVPYVGGDHRAHVGPYTAFFKAQEGKTHDVVLDATEGRKAVRILPPATRELPDVPRQPLTLAAVRAGSVDWAAKVPNLGDTPILVIVDSGRDARLGSSYLLPVATVTTEAPLRTVQFHRLDIDDVEVTLADGTKKNVAGTFRATSDAYRVGGPTNHGVDVPPGKYKVEVEYKHPVDGKALTFRTEANLE